MSSFSLLASLPPELLQEVIERLDKADLSSLSLVSKWSYDRSIPHIWKHVELKDCTTTREGTTDNHDDTPLLRKLLIFEKKPHIAEHVQVLTHSCHHPPPAIFYDLPSTSFASETLSSDPRTTKLVQLAALHMTKVHTLRLIYGHPHLNDALIRCFFSINRRRNNPIRRLWLENMRIGFNLSLEFPQHPLGLPQSLSFDGLESIRFRRLPMRTSHDQYPGRLPLPWLPARGCPRERWHNRQDGAGGFFLDRSNDAADEYPKAVLESLSQFSPYESHGLSFDDIFDDPIKWDSRVYKELNEQIGLPWNRLVDTQLAHYDSRKSLCHLSHGLSPDYTQTEDSSHVLYLEAANRPVKLMLASASELQQMSPERQQERFSALAMEHSVSIDEIYNLWEKEALPHVLKRASAHPMQWDPYRPTPAEIGLTLLRDAGSTLTSVTLDWVFMEATALLGGVSTWQSGDFWRDFFNLRFPHLKAFQFRNSCVEDTAPPEGLYLLDDSVPRLYSHAEMVDFDFVQDEIRLAGLRFVEAHSKLHCLAWPMAAFFSPDQPSKELAERVDRVIANLGRNLVDLRVDAIFRSHGEPLTDDTGYVNIRLRKSRRQFIERFAARMTKVESIKIEGGIPRDERREIVRALHACPLTKVVMIGVTFGVGNAWGDGSTLADRGMALSDIILPNEDKDTIYRLGSRSPTSIDHSKPFEASYGWPPQQPLIHTLASYHASTITEFKCCGYQASPILYTPSPITTPLLAGLKYLHNLKSLVLSFWLDTLFESAHRDAEIIKYWMDARSRSSTAVVRAFMNGNDENLDEGDWEKLLRERYAPDAIASEVTNIVGRLLSEQAKARKGGVHVRASICIGDAGGIFDMDMRIGKGSLNGDICLGYEGPRPELEEGRRRGKLENRRWF